MKLTAVAGRTADKHVGIGHCRASNLGPKRRDERRRAQSCRAPEFEMMYPLMPPSERQYAGRPFMATSEFGSSNGWHLGTMADRLSDADIDEIEQRVTKALEVAPPPWGVFVETRHATGGSSFVQVGDNPELDHEMYVDIDVGDDRWSSPDPRLDAITDLLGHAPKDIQLLLQEVRRIRARQA